MPRLPPYRVLWMCLVTALIAGCSSSTSPPIGPPPCTSLVITGNGDGQPFDVSGVARYEDRPFNTRRFIAVSPVPKLPVRGVPVEVVRCSDRAVLGTTTSDLTTGAYSFTGLINNGTAGVYVRITAQTVVSPISVSVVDTRNALYATFGPNSGFDERLAASFTRDVTAQDAGTLVGGVRIGDGGMGGVFNSLDVTVAALQYVDQSLGLGTTQPPLRLVWESNVTSGTFYDNSGKLIFLISQPQAAVPDTDEYDDMVITHEVGHYLAHQLSRDDSPGGSHFLTEGDQDARLSWSEGWGGFFASAATHNPDYLDTDGRTSFRVAYNIERISNAGGFVGGTSTTGEFTVAATLWDGLDLPASDVDSDPARLGIVPVLRAFSDLAIETRPATFTAFWQQLHNQGLLQGELDRFATAARSNRIHLNADVEPDDPSGNDQLAGAATLLPGQQAFATLAYPAGSVEDIDYFIRPLSIGLTYRIQTLGLADGADTVLRLFDPTGTTELGFNDNRDQQLYSAVCSGVSCPPNDGVRLSSELLFTAPSTGNYVIRVERSPAAPPSTDRFGRYTLDISIP